MRGGLLLLLALAASPTPAPSPDASRTVRGLVNTGVQVFEGRKHFDGGIATPFVDAGDVNAVLVKSVRFVSTLASSGGATDGGGNFICAANPAQSSPCVTAPFGPLELGGAVLPLYQPQDDVASVYIGGFEYRDGGSILDVLHGYGGHGPNGSEPRVMRCMANGDLQVFGNFLYLNMNANSSGGRVQSPNGGIYLDSTSGEVLVQNRAAGTVMSWYTGASTLVGELKDTGGLKLTTGPSRGQCTLNGASPSTCTRTVLSGALCICGYASGTGAAQPVWTISGTTGTCTGPNGASNTLNMICL